MHKILKISILVVVFVTFLNALFFFGMGIYFSIEAYMAVLHGDLAHFPGIQLMEALDRFMIGFVFVIFSIGLSRLFLSGNTLFKNYDLPWLKIEEFHQLKILMIAAILVAMFMAWIPAAMTHLQAEEKQWTVVLFPGCILILSVAGKFIKDLHS
jgi:uncharacterized membrane protein YqhA